MSQDSDGKSAHWEERLDAIDKHLEVKSIANAVKLCQTELEVAQKELGKFHPCTIQFQIKLGHILRKQDQQLQALDHYLDAREKLQKAYFSTHPLFADVFCAIADLYLDQGLEEEAEMFWLQALSIKEERFGSGTPHSIQILRRLADLFDRQERISEARELYLEILSLYQASDSTSHQEIGEIAATLGFLMAERREIGPAIEMLKRAVAELEQADEGDSSLFLQVVTTLGKLALEFGQHKEAEQALERISDLILSTDILNPELHASLLLQTAQLALGVGHPDRSSEYLKASLNILESHYGQESRELADAMLATGEFYYQGGDYEHASACLTRAYEYFNAHEPNQYDILSELQHNLGTLAAAEGKHSKACEHFECALELREGSTSANPERALSLLALGQVLKLQRRYPEAKDYLEEALTLRQELYAEESVPVEEARAALLEVLDVIAETATRKERSATRILQSEELCLPRVNANQNSSGAYEISSVAEKYNSALAHLNRQEFRNGIELLEEILGMIESKQGNTHNDLLPILDQLLTAQRAVGNENEIKKIQKKLKALQKSSSEMRS